MNNLNTEILPAPPALPNKVPRNIYHKLEPLDDAANRGFSPKLDYNFTKQTTPRPETADLSTEFDDSVLMPQEYPIKRNDLADQRPSTSLAPHIKKSSRNTNNSTFLTAQTKVGKYNHEWCDACGGEGRVIMCDGCDNSFHASCLDPPMDLGELSEDVEWYCRVCQFTNNKPRPPTNWSDQLMYHRDISNPKSFSLPVSIRKYFFGVETAYDGSYSTSSDTKPVKTDGTFSRFGAALTERDAYPTKDKHGNAVKCYKCKGSSAPSLSPSNDNDRNRAITASSTTSTTHTEWRKMISCDYCNCYWHLDCLTPPITQIPSMSRMWMCPLHAEHAKSLHMKMKNRIPKENIKEVNNKLSRSDSVTIIGNSSKRSKKSNDRLDREKFHIPEQSIQLDFWNKVKKGKGSRLRYSKSFLEDVPTVNAVEGLMALSKPSPSETRKMVRRVMQGRSATIKEENDKGEESDSSSLSSAPVSDDEESNKKHLIDESRLRKIKTIERLLHIKGEKETIEFLIKSMESNIPFKWRESKRIPHLKPSSRNSPKFVDHTSVGSCVAIPEDFVVNHRTPIVENTTKVIHKPVHLPKKPFFPDRKSSLQKANDENDKIDNKSIIKHNRLPSSYMPLEIKEEIKMDKDWATNLLNDAFRI
ncbi:hypothetical protein E3Q13_00705 [Wallemia mellicola]|nr:hypothetical protein E3Q13_00705 [Wallemia mellicola]